MSDRRNDGVRVVAIVCAAICFAVLVIAFGVFLMAASREAKDFLGGVTNGGVVAALIFIIAWASAKGMRTS